MISWLGLSNDPSEKPHNQETTSKKTIKESCLGLRWGTGKSSYSLWWLIFYGKLPGPWDAQMFLSESETVTLEKLNTWVGDQNKAANPLQLGEHHPPGYGSQQTSRVEESPVLLCWVLGLRAESLVFHSYADTNTSWCSCSLCLYTWTTKWPTSFPKSPSCRWLITGLLSLHNKTNQYLKINGIVYIGEYTQVLLVLSFRETRYSVKSYQRVIT